jgi:hypothetical protein
MTMQRSRAHLPGVEVGGPYSSPVLWLARGENKPQTVAEIERLRRRLSSTPSRPVIGDDSHTMTQIA